MLAAAIRTVSVFNMGAHPSSAGIDTNALPRGGVPFRVAVTALPILDGHASTSVIGIAAAAIEAS